MAFQIRENNDNEWIASHKASHRNLNGSSLIEERHLSDDD